MKSPRDITSGSSTDLFSTLPGLIIPMIVSKSLSNTSETVKLVPTTNCLMKFRKFSFPSLAVIILFFCQFPQFPKQHY